MTSMKLLASSALVVFGVATCFAGAAGPAPTTIAPKALPRVGTIDERFQSYNIEMVEVTGGRFWKPYASTITSAPTSANQPTGVDPSLFEYRKPINLYNTRLRKLATALGPAYVRVSGTWANSTYFQNTDGPAPETAPAGFKGVLTRQQWKGVVDFANATGSKIVTSFAISPGVRDVKGVWTSEQAKQFLDYTTSLGSSIAAAEFMNEPTIAYMGGAPKDYDAAAFGRDIAVFHAFIKKAAPDMIVLGPGGLGERQNINPTNQKSIRSEDILAITGPVFDAFSYHSYGAVSSRCYSATRASATTTADAALTEDWLARSDLSEQYYAGLRDRYEPGKPMWLTETAQTACGGDRWASTFLDSFRYLNQLGELAKRGVQVHLHNTLAASDYGLLDEKTYEPRPNYWSALMWHKLMGTTVLDPGASPASSLHIYAQCLRNYPGGVALLVINTDVKQAQSLNVPTASERFTLTAHELTDKQVQLNGVDLKLAADDSLPELKGSEAQAGELHFAPTSITFLAISNADNKSCQP